MSASALLKSVLASPDDDLPRLVYADWLDENGDPARAEFIRTQIELAKLSDHDPQYRHLEDREHELLSEHEPGWLNLDSPWWLREWEWRRGFVDEITANNGALKNLDGALFDAHSVTHVRSSGRNLGDDTRETEWEASPWVQQVRKLSVVSNWCQVDELAAFLTAANPPYLTALDFSNNPGISTVGDLIRFNHLRERARSLSFGGRSGIANYDGAEDAINIRDLCERLERAPLEHLTCFDVGITSEGLATLLTAPFAGTLKHLDISDNPIAPDAYRAFQQCHPAMRLDKLDVSGTPLAGISLEPLLSAASLQRLTKLEMNGCGSARRNMEVLANSAFWTQATELRAHSGTIPASTLEPLCGLSGPPALRLLDLADNYLRTEGVRQLCESPWAGSLTWLALSRNYLDDESCEVLAKSGRFTNLRTLHLAHNHFTQDGAEGEQITSRGVMALAESPSLANLRLLTLSYTGITDAAVDVVVNAPFWRLFGLGIGGCNLSPAAVRTLANSPRLNRFVWLDVSDNRRLGGQALRPLAESPFLNRLCELDCGGIDIADDVRAIFRERLGPRFSH